MGNQKYFISGIGTGCGKTLVSAILAKKIQAAYWKPIQCGALDNTDTDFVKHTTNAECIPEQFALERAASPHYAARLENKNIQLNDFSLPEEGKNLIAEGAGGLLVPVNAKHTVLDLAIHLKMPIVLVVNFYLGSINHTLLSIELLKIKNAACAGLIFNGNITKSSAEVIRLKSPFPVLAQIPHTDVPDKNFIKKMAENLHFQPPSF